MKIQFYSIALLSILLIFTRCGKDDAPAPAPEITVSTSDFSTTIPENPAAGTILGSVAGSTNSGSVTFSLQTESVAGALSINSNNGQLTVADATVFDFETNPSITGTVQVANGSISQTANITITLTDVDEAMPETIWTGATMTFTKAAGSDPMAAANQDMITDKVILGRLNTGGQLLNLASETTANQATSPAGTEWAAGTTANLDGLTFGTFRDLGKPKEVLVGNSFVLKLVEENILIDVTFISWATGKNGAFSYERSTSN